MTRLEILRQTLNDDAIAFLSKHFDSDDFAVVPLAGDASSRRYYRIVFADKSWVLMSWEPFPNPDTFPFLNVLKHFQKHQVQVPEVVDFSSEHGLVLLEDLGDLTLERKFWENQNQELVLPFYRQAIDELIKIHFFATADEDPKCSAFQVAFDTKKFMWEMNYGREHVLEKLNALPMNTKTQESLTRIFTEICERLDREPKYLAHRDYHSRNLMMKLGKMRVIDFQDARLGPIQYDLVSLLHDSYVNLSENSQREILKYYLDCAKPHLPGKFSRDHFDEIFRLQLLQRCFKACGSFASFYNLRSDRRYLKYIQPTLIKVAAMLGSFPQYSDFLKVIEDNGLLERKYENL
ncbi:MAG: aminoglycoside phosphotransferase family protein [Bdellovibrionales bacterium]